MLLPSGKGQRMQLGQLRRRDLIITVLGGAAAWPLTARTQQSAKLPSIGFLGNDATAWAPWTAAFDERLRELGWIEGRTVTIEYRWSQARPERYAEIAAEFARLPVNIIFTFGPAVATVRQTTAGIPIVFALATDPVAGGLVASLARPGANVTGLSHEANDLAGKCLEVLRQVAPRLRRLAIIANVGYPQSVLEMG
jgi:putative ABC transport system substrate-binding protein